MKLGLYARGRRVLHEFAELAPEHVMIKAMRALYVNKANQIVKDTEGLNGPERLDGLTEALRIWPELDGAACSLRQGVRGGADAGRGGERRRGTPGALGPLAGRCPGHPAALPPDPGQRRRRRPQGEEARPARRVARIFRPGPAAAAADPAGFFWSDGSRPVSAIDVARDLVDRTDPHSPRYEARWAELLDRVEVTDLTRVEVRLNRAPLQAGLWLLGPVGPAHASIDGRVATAGRDRPLVSDGAYQCFTANGEQVELRLRDDRATSASGEATATGRRARPAGAADQANSRGASAAGPVGGRGLEAGRGEFDRSRSARSGRGARGVGGHQGRELCCSP